MANISNNVTFPNNVTNTTINNSKMHTYLIRILEYGTTVELSTITKIRNLFAIALNHQNPADFIRIWFDLCNIPWNSDFRLTKFHKIGSDPSQANQLLESEYLQNRISMLAIYVDLSSLETRAALQVAYQVTNMSQVDSLHIPYLLKFLIKELMWKMGKDTPWLPLTPAAKKRLIPQQTVIAMINTLKQFLDQPMEQNNG